MATITLGRTGLQVEQNGFGALPIQRISREEAVQLLRRAYAGGMNFFDTARGYTDSEEKMGHAFSGMRDKIVIATKTPARTTQDFWKNLETSLRLLRTDYIDIYQFHNPSFLPRPDDETGLYDAMLEARAQGKIRYIGFTNHRIDVAQKAVESGLYDTLQFPFSYLSGDRDIALVESCWEQDMGFIAMKALSGGLIIHAAAACAWLTRYTHVIPIWGIQRMSELADFLACIKKPPQLDNAVREIIEADKAALDGAFCRGCGYCMPCPQGIEINMCARMSLLLRRAPAEGLLSESGQQRMRQIELCTECGQCIARCPYDLDTPALIKKNYQDYLEVLAGKPL